MRRTKGYVEIDRNGLQVLERDECLRLLRTATLGRIAITFGALPVILPVNFVLLGDRVVLRTGVGTKLDAAICNAIVAFEVDAFEPMSHTGWSVVVTGQAREITNLAELDALDPSRIPRWAPRGGDRVVEISTEMVTGRRILPGGPRGSGWR
jgi:nitroimidazol reductase NimA-like FMN-containing flavoprotein (pyridoxamine 5'-phosphate oxidase superfamily)